MQKIYFQCDYAEGACPEILERLAHTNLEQTLGYGEDIYCEQAAEKTRRACEDETLAVHFMVGGTQANLTIIDAALRAHQGVICAETGHINVHETGAVESCGHKVLALPCGEEGKLTAEQVRRVCREHNALGRDHMVQPGMVYLSSPTELGTIYSAAELKDLHEACREYGLYLFLDGARLGYGLAASDNDLTLPLLAKYTDVFYIGGTKVGALFGEAVVISSETLKKDFRYIMKQKGGLLAKGRLLGIQFDTLFTDGLYFEIAARANRYAEEIREAMRKKGYIFLAPNHTNQIFVEMPDRDLEVLGERFVYSYDRRVDDTHSLVRFCTSWATKEGNVEALVHAIEAL